MWSRKRARRRSSVQARAGAAHPVQPGSAPRSTQAAPSRTRFRLGAAGQTCNVPRCELCGNDYDKAFEITVGGETHVFDSFECAIHVLAPACEHCGCKVVGHGVEADGRIFCCAHCARRSGVTDVADRA